MLRRGEKVTLVVEGVVSKEPDDIGLFDVDYGPGWVTAVEAQLLENSAVVRRMVETARAGVAWRRWDEVLERWVCPRCTVTWLTEEQSREGLVCEGCCRSAWVESLRRAEMDRVWEELKVVLDEEGLVSPAMMLTILKGLKKRLT